MLEMDPVMQNAKQRKPCFTKARRSQRGTMKTSLKLQFPNFTPLVEFSALIW